jgi:hypothetical protein
MTSPISSIVAQLESGGGASAGNQPASMVDPTYGQYSGFTSKYGSGAAGVDNYASQVLAANPGVTLGDFYSSYVMGTGNPAKLTSPLTLATQYPGAYNNMVRNAGAPLDTPLASLMGGGGMMAEGPVHSSSGIAAGSGAGSVTGADILGHYGTPGSSTSGSSSTSSGTPGFFGPLIDAWNAAVGSTQNWIARAFIILVGLTIAGIGLWKLLPPDTRGQISAAGTAALAA